MAGIHLQGKSEFAHFLSLRYSFGIAFDFRFVTAAMDINESDLVDVELDTALIKEYFWSGNRFVFPTAGLGFDFRTSPRMSFGIEARVWMPVYRWQTGEDLPPLEGWRFGACFRATFLHETPDSKIDTELDRIKIRFQTVRNDYAFLLHYLINHSPPSGISPEELSAAVIKTYRHSRLYSDARRGISPPLVVNMFADVPAAAAVFDYDPLGAVIKRK